jgi:hypothetical protein
MPSGLHILAPLLQPSQNPQACRPLQPILKAKVYWPTLTKPSPAPKPSTGNLAGLVKPSQRRTLMQKKDEFFTSYLIQRGLIEVVLLTVIALPRTSSLPKETQPNMEASLLAKRPSSPAQFFDLNEAV